VLVVDVELVVQNSVDQVNGFVRVEHVLDDVDYINHLIDCNHHCLLLLVHLDNSRMRSTVFLQVRRSVVVVVVVVVGVENRKLVDHHLLLHFVSELEDLFDIVCNHTSLTNWLLNLIPNLCLDVYGLLTMCMLLIALLVDYEGPFLCGFTQTSTCAL